MRQPHAAPGAPVLGHAESATATWQMLDRRETASTKRSQFATALVRVHRAGGRGAPFGPMMDPRECSDLNFNHYSRESHTSLRRRVWCWAQAGSAKRDALPTLQEKRPASSRTSHVIASPQLFTHISSCSVHDRAEPHMGILHAACAYMHARLKLTAAGDPRNPGKLKPMEVPSDPRSRPAVVRLWHRPCCVSVIIERSCESRSLRFRDNHRLAGRHRRGHETLY